jgi:hypothetical protein
MSLATGGDSTASQGKPAGVETSGPFLTVAFGTPVDIGFLPREPVDDPGELLTVGWQAKLGTTYLPYDPDDERPSDT